MRVRFRVVTALLLAVSLLAGLLTVGAQPAQAQSSTFDQELIRLANQHRASLGLQPLVASSTLSAGAMSWSQQMLRTGNFEHASNLGRLGENIAYSHGPVGIAIGITWSRSAGALPSYCRSSMDYTTAAFIMCSWLSSPGHRRAIESSSYRQIGSGTATGPGAYGRLTYSTHRFSTDAPSSPAPTPAPPTNVNSAEPGHSVDANTSGDRVTLALKQDGKLWVRRDVGSGWTAWQQLGAGSWKSGDVTISPNGAVHVAAVKTNGQLYTQKWNAAGTWTGWVNHGSGWDADTTPSISSNSSRAVLAAITSQGFLRTKVYQSTWSGSTAHGANGWAHVDIDIAADGDLWFAATKTDGRLFLRKHLGNGWSGFAAMGAPTWSTETPPAIAARSNGVVFGAVKADGRLYTRQQSAGRWLGYARQGVRDWTSVDVAISEQGHVWLAAHKDWGRLYTHHQAPSGAWSAWTSHGADTWSTDADPSIAIGAGGQPVLVAVKESGVLYYRARTSAWGSWTALGRGAWATGN